MYHDGSNQNHRGVALGQDRSNSNPNFHLMNSYQEYLGSSIPHLFLKIQNVRVLIFANKILFSWVFNLANVHWNFTILLEMIFNEFSICFNIDCLSINPVTVVAALKTNDLFSARFLQKSFLQKTSLFVSAETSS